MANTNTSQIWDRLPPIPADKPVLIAGPTASGKSELALRIAETFGGVIVNADASQVYSCWQVISARPSAEDQARAPHQLYGHIAFDQDYSTGHWLREIKPLLSGPQRPIIVGGTGLYFSALTEGMADIPATPPDIRTEADQLTLPDLIRGVDCETLTGIDTQNRARVQRAWEVQRATGRGLRDWQNDTPPPVLNIADTVPIVFDVDKQWLVNRINLRFDLMLDTGALQEVKAMHAHYDASLSAFKAIGVPELMAYLDGSMTLEAARERATISTRQFAKRQRTWFRARMKNWNRVDFSK
jgi:tRNA dimethylallyltransferase